VYLYNLDDCRKRCSTRTPSAAGGGCRKAIVDKHVEEFLPASDRGTRPAIDKLYKRFHSMAGEETGTHDQQAAEPRRR